MLRPLILSENFPPDRGGMAQSCDRIVRALRARGVDVDVAHFSRRASGVRVEQNERGRYIACEVEQDASHSINLLWAALTQCESRPTHVLAFGGLLPMLAGPAFAAWLGVPFIALLRGNDFDTGIVSLRRGWMLRDALNRAARICTVSRDQQRRVAMMFPQATVSWIANGIDASAWQLLDIDRAQAREWRQGAALGTRRVLGMFGHLKRKKGGAFLLEALQHSGLAEKIHLLLVGELEPQMQEQLQTPSAGLCWTHIPFVDRYELLQWYAACDVLAIPSLYDGLPNVVLEAGALGVAIMASSAGGMADVLRDGENALTFRPGDIHDCRRALQAAVMFPAAELARLGERLQAEVLATFDHHAEAARYHEMLLETAAGAASGPTQRTLYAIHGRT